MVAQNPLFPSQWNQSIEKLSDEELERLTINFYTLIHQQNKLTDEEQEKLERALSEFFAQKQRIYQKAESQWRAQQEAAQEAQESLFEEHLLAQLL